jgi:predicted GIY-YIG superfamily endonuclease
MYRQLLLRGGAILSFFAYMLLCADGTYYVGHTDDLERRIAEHHEGGKCVHTSDRQPVRLVWSAECSTRDGAKAIEGRVKNWSRAKKAALAHGDFEGLHQAAKKKWDRAQRP